MLRNYFKIALRNLSKHKGYSFISITGLALGIACCLLIFMYVKEEVTFDKYHANSEDIYRITSEFQYGDNDIFAGISAIIEAPEYTERIPEILSFTRFSEAAILVKNRDQFINQFNAVFSDPSVFETFNFDVISGTLDHALTELNRIVITKSNAIKYFGDANAVGKELTILLEDEPENYIIDAVIEDLPSNSSMAVELIIPWAKYEAIEAQYGPGDVPWIDFSASSFLKLKSGANPLIIEKKINEVRGSLISQREALIFEGVHKGLQPLTDIHLNNEIRGKSPGLKAGSNADFSYILSAIALVILILACINFANLTVARSLPRAKEIGVRKVLGALKEQLTFQFLSEALFVSLLSFVIGLIIAELFLPKFGELVNKQFTNNVFEDPVLIGSCFLLVILTALLAGTYPAFAIARFSVISSLNGKLKLSGKRYISKGLVLIQFTIAGILVVGTIAMNSQINHLLRVDLGYNDENLVVIDTDDYSGKGELLKNKLLSNPQFYQMALTNVGNTNAEIVFGQKKFVVAIGSVEENYFDMLEVPLLAGRWIKDGGDDYIRGNDTLGNMLVNERFLEEVGLNLNTAIQKVIGRNRIVGIIGNYKQASANNEVEPMSFISEKDKEYLRYLTIKFNPDYITEVKREIESAWKELGSYQPLDISFEEEKNQNAFTEEQRWKKIITYSTFIAIAISCLGLFGLAHLTAQQRQKEIGVRKVLGASVRQLVLLLNSSFSKLVLLSFILTVPIAYYLVSNWLDNFIDKIEIGVLLFLVPAAITFGIATLTVSIQSFKTANSNPVNSLRNE